MGNCTSCLSTPGCGFCLSSLECLTGSANGPASGPGCPDWIVSSSSCPGNYILVLLFCFILLLQRASQAVCCAVPPACGGYNDCASCADVDECAWCASESRCISLSEAFSSNCRGTVFIPPCPASFVAGERLDGQGFGALCPFALTSPPACRSCVRSESCGR